MSIYGEYVGRVRAHQFVEIRARVEGYLEKMLFEEGTYISKDQLLFVISQDRYKARVDKAKAQLKKDQAQARKAERDLKKFFDYSSWFIVFIIFAIKIKLYLYGKI